MHRLFGKPKQKVEAPTLGDTSTNIGNRVKDCKFFVHERAYRYRLGIIILIIITNNVNFACLCVCVCVIVDDKINGLNGELKKYSEQLKKATGPTAANIKRRAMEVLKRKRMYENQRDQMANQQFNIDQTAFAIDSIKDAQTTVAAMKDAAKTLKKENKKLNLNDIDNMQDEIEDMLEDVGEISEILGRSYGMPDGVEEEDLDAELACLEDEWAAEAEAEAQAATSAPVSTPVSAPPMPSSVFSLPAQPSRTVTAGATAVPTGQTAAGAQPVAFSNIS
jgi:charged multivesicular body protein 5